MITNCSKQHWTIQSYVLYIQRRSFVQCLHIVSRSQTAGTKWRSGYARLACTLQSMLVPSPTMYGHSSKATLLCPMGLHSTAVYYILYRVRFYIILWGMIVVFSWLRILYVYNTATYTYYIHYIHIILLLYYTYYIIIYMYIHSKDGRCPLNTSGIAYSMTYAPI